MHKGRASSRLAVILSAAALSACALKRAPLIEAEVRMAPDRPLLKEIEAVESVTDKQRTRQIFRKIRHGEFTQEDIRELESMAEPAALLDGLRGDDDVCQLYAARMLGRMGYQRAVPDILRILPGHKYEYDLIVLLGEFKDPRASPALRQRLSSYDPSTRAAAAVSLGRIKDRSAIKDILALLKDKEGGVRKGAAEALGHLGDPAALGELNKTLQDKEQFVRAATIQAIGRIGQSAVPMLLDGILYGDPDYRIERLESLIAIGSGAVPLLTESLEYGDALIRSFSARALGNIRDKSAVPALEKALADQEATVRGDAANALRMIGERSSLGKLAMAAKSDESPYVRAAAAAAVRELSAR